MPNVDERLEERIGRTLLPVPTERVIEQVASRRMSVHRRRRVGSVLLAAGVLAATVAGSLLLGQVFRSDADEQRPASPTNGALVVRVVRGEGNARAEHLELVPLDGSPPQRLTPDLDGYMQGLSASPDGRQIAYSIGDGGGGASLIVHDLATGEQRVLLRGGISGPSWSPDGSTIAYYAYGDRTGIATIPADGSGPPTYVPGTDVTGGDPSWSPDGTHVAFEERDVPGGPAVMTVDIATGSLRKLASTDGDTPANPVYSPDGSRIAFALTGGLWQVNPEGDDPTLVVGMTREEYYATSPGPSAVFQGWSPDGSSLVYVQQDGDGDGDAYGESVYVDGLDGSAPRKITDGSDVLWLPATDPAVSPTLATG
jgi:Tol biopolymer transport system component